MKRFLLSCLLLASLSAVAQADVPANLKSLRLAIEDLTTTYGEKYKDGASYLARLEKMEQQVTDGKTVDQTELDKLRHDALLANPLLDFDKLLLVNRSAKSPNLGLPQNWQGNCALKKDGYDNEIAVLSPVTPEGKLTTLYRPKDGSNFVGDVDLHFDAEKMLFSMPGEKGRWQIFEIDAEGKNLRQVTKGPIADNHQNYDACYLPSDKIIFGSTACQHGVPCVGGGNTVANLFQMTADGESVRQLCFDQDHNWCPTILNNGRVLYTRWEYSDAQHYFTRILMQMNPDGVSQMHFYGSNSIWPNSLFYTRPIPGSATKVVSVISGHHGVPRMGEMVIFDTAKGRHEASGAVQRIPGYGKKVEPKVADRLVDGSWPKFLHPYPLSENYFITSMKPNKDAKWGIYLVDVFDNMLLIKEQEGRVLFEPVPFRATTRPPVVPERVRPGSPMAMAMITDVHFGPGLQGVPRGKVKALRLFEQHYGYPGMGGHLNIGIDGPWDVKRILGTVPVEADGSATFMIPPNTPIAVQPLDENGRALQVMRSWFVAQPGENISCIGCHESSNVTPPVRMTLASRRRPSMIKPWYGNARGFSFTREVQPVLDKHCVGCHDGKKKGRPDLRVDGDTPAFRNFTKSYIALHPFVRRPGPESDAHLQVPCEWHASTSPLVQMIEKGHHGVKLDEEAWDRINTWIDLNVPDKGSWSEHRAIRRNAHAQRSEMRKLYANIQLDPEEIAQTEVKPVSFVKPKAPAKPKPFEGTVANWPIADAAKAAQAAVSDDMPKELTLELAEDVEMKLALVPAGDFVMGSIEGGSDEYPQSAVKIEKPFYMGVYEISNAQLQAFNPEHDSGVISQSNKDHGSRGYKCTNPSQPAIRVSYQQAMAFCKWLSEKTGRNVLLPTEAQWEWACRAGSADAFSFGKIDADYSKFANLADKTMTRFARRDSPKWHLRDDRFDDKRVIHGVVSISEPNAFGLHNMHGNIAEWTRSDYKAYPFSHSEEAAAAKSVRGGSWYDRPKQATSSFRTNYEPWRQIYNVGFRVIVE